MDLTNIFRPFHPTTTECTFSSSACRVSSRIGHMLDHKTILSEDKNVIIQSIFKNTIL